MSSKVRLAVLLLGMLVMAGCGGGLGPAGAAKNRIRFEHVALNVEDSVKVAEWYRDNLGMKIMYEGGPPGNGRFLSDAGGNMMFEFYHAQSAGVPDYASMNNRQLHIAFMVDDVKGICDKLVGAGGRLDGEIKVNPAGDVIAVVRDPWGIPIQFVKRAKPMLSHN